MLWLYPPTTVLLEEEGDCDAVLVVKMNNNTSSNSRSTSSSSSSSSSTPLSSLPGVYFSARPTTKGEDLMTALVECQLYSSYSSSSSNSSSGGGGNDSEGAFTVEQCLADVDNRQSPFKLCRHEERFPTVDLVVPPPAASSSSSSLPSEEEGSLDWEENVPLALRIRGYNEGSVMVKEAKVRRRSSSSSSITTIR